VISGFNSDIEFQGTVYHVQTEDKGLTTPIILSLVYSRGEILASKRSPYDDLIAAGFDEAELSDRLQRQHKLIIAAIRSGRIDDLKRMTMKESLKRRPSKVKTGQMDIPLIDDSPQVEKSRVEKQPQFEKEVEEDPLVIPADIPRAEPATVPVGMPSLTGKEASPIPRPDDELIIEVPINILEEPFFDDVEVVEYGDLDEETILPAEAVKIITDHVGSEVVDENNLKIRLLGRTTFYSGDDAMLDILVARGGKLGRGIGGAHIVVKVLGSSFRPMIFHTRADDNGISQVHLQIPEFSTGRAAILIKAAFEGEEIELRQVVTRR
jgi:hypothetical protein